MTCLRPASARFVFFPSLASRQPIRKKHQNVSRNSPPPPRTFLSAHSLSMFRKANSLFAARVLSSSQPTAYSLRVSQIHTIICPLVCRTPRTAITSPTPQPSVAPISRGHIGPNLVRKLNTNIPSLQKRDRRTSIRKPTVNYTVRRGFKPESSRHLTMAIDFNDRDILPSTVKPINYDISIYDLELGGDFTYQGTVNILSKVVNSSKEIVLNSHQLKIHSAEVKLEHSKTQQTFTASEISYDVPRQRVTLSFPEEVPISEKASIVLRFQGTINNDMAGFYRSKYKPTGTPAPSVPKDGEHHVMFSTQFER